jgi:cyclophilin family peptidyl-prolyl cis-trans isomerase
MKYLILSILLIFIFLNTNAQKIKGKDYLVTLKTTKGVAHIILYDDTPLHKANFLKLVNTHFYDSLLFHRVIQNFMIQGGDPTSKRAKAGDKLGSGGGDMERIPFEYSAKRIHKKGALAAANNGNSAKKSNACQFYIVQGKKLNIEEITKTEKANNITYTTEQKADYLALGGYPSLDNKYTIFGEVLDNIKLIDEIINSPKDDEGRPTTDVLMKIKAKKMRKKRINRVYKYKFL